MKKRITVGALLLCFCATPGFARAGDGRIELNQACIATGCFAGDGPGFPIETAAGGSYVLTSSLVVPDSNTRAVQLADRAVLDLNGFEIAGPTTCSGTPASCSAAGVGDGVYAQDHTTIRNGTIRGMGRYGIAGEVGVTVEGVLVQGNASTGLYFNYGSDGPEGHLVRHTRVVGNGGNGILTSGGSGGIGSLVTDTTAFGNAQAGMSLLRTQVTNCTIARNGSFGISGSSNTLGQNTLLYNNGGNDQSQTSGSFLEIGTNVCGIDTSCP